MANNLSGPWTELEDVRPSHLRASRTIKMVFSGNLNKSIISNPWFNGKESDLLRCQIARISHHITVIPNVNSYKIVPDSRDIEPSEDPIPQPSINDCLNIKNWVHFVPGILKEGRLVHMEKDPGEVDPDIFKKQIVDADPFDALLKSVVDDKSIKCPIPNITIPAWKLSYCYDDKIYTNPHVIIVPDDEESLKKDTSVNNTIVHLRSLTWPGGHAIRIKGQMNYLYFGWGMKYNDDVLDDKFVFTSFPKIQEEVVDQPVGEEPNGEPEPVEEDGDNKSKEASN